MPWRRLCTDLCFTRRRRISHRRLPSRCTPYITFAAMGKQNMSNYDLDERIANGMLIAYHVTVRRTSRLW